jgi:hypothetical protein
MQGAIFCNAQSTLVATIEGAVFDAVTQARLEGALVVLKSLDGESHSSVSGPDGKFRFEVAPGRYVVEVSLLGYGGAQEEALAVSGRSLSLKIWLNERATELEGVTVSARPAATDSRISLPIEKVLRMPANFFDPVRMLSSFPGVMTANDQANNIIIKGNSPSGLLWRLNGMDIVNPNHLANAGTTNDKPTANGGGVNILSAQMLDETSFYASNIPARYGNFTSGVLDMSLRNGNEQKHEYTAQASLLGLDFAAEGPLNKSGTSSFLANYRYSTVGLLSQMGVNFGGEEIAFQDFSFNLRQTGRWGSLSFFGLGGASSNTFNAKPLTEWEVDKDRFDIFYKSKMGGLGVRFDRHLGLLNLSAGATLSGNEETREASSYATQAFPLQESAYESRRTLLSTFAGVSGALTDVISMDAGLMVNFYSDDLFNEETLPDIQPITLADATANFALVQPHAQLTGRAGRFSVEAGGRYLYSTYSGDQALDYRGSIAYAITPQMSLSVVGGQVSQMLQPGVYLINGNGDLGFIHKSFAELVHTINLAKWKFISTGYYQEYRDVPVQPISNFSVLNMMDGVAPQDLQTNGAGTNTGVTFQAERSFLSAFYVLTGASLYRSRYADAEGEIHSTRFDGKYSLQVTLGHERSRPRENSKNAFGVHTRFLVLGGLRETPVDEQLSRSLGATVRNFTAPNSISLRDYFRMDLRLSWRKDKATYTRTVGIDVQNLTGFLTTNEGYTYFDNFQDKTLVQYQVGIIPVLVYRIDF